MGKEKNTGERYRNSKSREQVYTSADKWRKLSNWYWPVGFLLYMSVWVLAIVILYNDGATLIQVGLLLLLSYTIVGAIISKIASLKLRAKLNFEHNNLMRKNVQLGFIGPDDECCEFHTKQAEQRQKEAEEANPQ